MTNLRSEGGHPGRSWFRLIALLVFLLVDVAAVLSLGAILYDARKVEGSAGGGLVICASLLVVVVGFAGCAVVAARRARPRLAILLAALPAVPATVIGAALLFFVMTFHHQP